MRMRTAPPDDAEKDCAAYLISLFNPPLKASVYGGDELARTPANLAPRLIHVTAAPVNRMLRGGNFRCGHAKSSGSCPALACPRLRISSLNAVRRAEVYTEFSLRRLRMATLRRRPRQKKPHDPRAGSLGPILGFISTKFDGLVCSLAL